MGGCTGCESPGSFGQEVERATDTMDRGSDRIRRSLDRTSWRCRERRTRYALGPPPRGVRTATGRRPLTGAWHEAASHLDTRIDCSTQVGGFREAVSLTRHFDCQYGRIRPHSRFGQTPYSCMLKQCPSTLPRLFQYLIFLKPQLPEAVAKSSMHPLRCELKAKQRSLRTPTIPNF